MARARRPAAPNAVHHVVNRGNRKKVIFQKRADYRAFMKVLGEACAKFEMRLLAFCVMPNHWHLLLWPGDGVSVSDFMHWLTSTHVRRYHVHYGLTGTGHLYQDRYRDRLCLDERGVLSVIRYVEANALTARLVQRAEHWPWSSLRVRTDGDEGRLLTACPVPLPDNWVQHVNETKRKDVDAANRACGGARGSVRNRVRK